VKSLYETMTYSFLTKLTNASNNVDIEQLTDMGLSPEQADRISRLPHAYLLKLCSFQNIIDITIDEELLSIAIERGSKQQRRFGDIPDMNITNTLLSNLATHASDPDEYRFLFQNLNLSPKFIPILASYSLLDILAVVKTGIIWYEITANSLKLEMALSQVEEAQLETELLRTLIKRDASFPMINALTGMGKAVFIDMRKAMGVPVTKGGPPRRLTDEEHEVLYYAWNETEGEPLPKRCLAVSKAIDNIPLRHIWPYLSKMIKNEIPQFERVTTW